jgi:hypothetical protein
LAYTFDGDAKTITLSTGTTSFSWGDAYSRWKDWANSDGPWASFAFHAIGGDDLGGGVRAGDYYFLQPGWTIVPQDADHVLIASGNGYPSVPGTQMFGTRPGRTVQIQLSRSSLTQTLAVGSGVLPADITAIATATRDQILDDGTRFSGANIDAAISESGGLTEEQAAALVELQLRVLELWRLQGLDLSNPLTVSATSRAVASIAQTLATVGRNTTVTRTT